MLQQTQVLRVLIKYSQFLEVFPSVYDLAGASVGEVLRMWKGMGYNRRALYLKRTAEQIVSQYQGKFPKTEKELVQLSGVGTYTARAIMVFAYRQDIAMIDTNIRHIFTHFFFHDISQKESLIQDIADQLLPKGKSWEWHQALMDYGAEESSKFKIQSSKVKKQSIPFKESDRFYRGRIIDTLRDERITEKSLIKDFALSYQKPENELQDIIKKLITDGLIVRSKSYLCIPE